MKKGILKVMTLFLCLFLMLPLVSCGGEGEDTDAGADGKTDTENIQTPSSESESGDATDENTDPSDSNTVTGGGEDTQPPPEDSTQEGGDTQAPPGPDTSDHTQGTDTQPQTNPGTSSGGIDTEPPDTTDDSGNVTEDTDPIPDTTNPVTTEPPAPTVRTNRPTTLKSIYIAPDRFLLYGEVEMDSTVTVYDGSKKIAVEKSRGPCFYIELPSNSAEMNLDVTATANGKLESYKLRVRIPYTPLGSNAPTFGGKNSQLFYTPTLDFYLGSQTASLETLFTAKGFLQANLKRIREATGKNTEIIFLICPNPVSIYYDGLNSYIPMMNQWNTPASQLINYMKGTEGIHFADLYSVLMEHREEPIFHQTDTHWTELGAYYAYAEMMKFVRQSFPKAATWGLDDFNLVYIKENGGDLANSMIPFGTFEWTPYLNPKFSTALRGPYFEVKRAHSAVGIHVGTYPLTSSIPNQNLPVGYLLGDSYGANLIPFAALGFREFYLNGGGLWNYTVDFNLLREKKPDYVIYVYTERNFRSDLGQAFLT